MLEAETIQNRMRENWPNGLAVSNKSDSLIITVWTDLVQVEGAARMKGRPKRINQGYDRRQHGLIKQKD